MINNLSSGVRTVPSVLQQLVGRSIITADQSGSLNLSFQGASLAIMNPCVIVREGAHAESVQPSELPGLSVDMVLEAEDSVTLRLSHGVSMRVDLRTEAYVGPEAMVLHIVDGPIVVW